MMSSYKAVIKGQTQDIDIGISQLAGLHRPYSAGTQFSMFLCVGGSHEQISVTTTSIKMQNRFIPSRSFLMLPFHICTPMPGPCPLATANLFSIFHVILRMFPKWNHTIWNLLRLTFPPRAMPWRTIRS